MTAKKIKPLTEKSALKISSITGDGKPKAKPQKTKLAGSFEATVLKKKP